ncbi:hypothetical protein HDK90DRAFT_533431 [Phyllosticta capitalensis]|uniref:Uncharacterized protein n=1 Tax=Phyllosticta capitalensis TaxID=121624 RepID=A0ABR1YPR3_9PEZI
MPMVEWQGSDPAEVEHRRTHPSWPFERPTNTTNHENLELVEDVGPDPQAQELVSLRQNLEETKKKLQEKTQEANDLEDQLERETTQLTLDNGDLKQKVKDLRNFMLTSNSGEGRWRPEDDANIRLAVCHLQKGLRSWAKGRCPKSFEERRIDVLCRKGNKRLMELIRPVADFESFQSIMQSESLYLVLAAILSEFIQTNILSKQFFHLQNTTQGDATSSFPSKATQFFEMLESNDPEEAITWRAQTIRSVFPDPGHSGTMHAIHARDPMYPKGTTLAQMSTVYRNLAAKFIGGPCATIFKKELTRYKVVRSNEHLYELMVMAGNIHFCLLTQKSKLVWVQPSAYLGRPFSVHSSLYQPGSALCVNNRDELNEGKLVQVVFSTSLIGYGHSRSHNQERRCIIVGASVYLDQKRPALPLEDQEEPEIIDSTF